MLHIIMLCFGWSGFTMGWLIGVGILLCDLCTALWLHFAELAATRLLLFLFLIWMVKTLHVHALP